MSDQNGSSWRTTAPARTTMISSTPRPPAEQMKLPAPISLRHQETQIVAGEMAAGIACEVTFSRKRAAMSGACRRIEVGCAKERSTISPQLEGFLRPSTPDNSRVRLLVTARRAAPSPCQTQNLNLLGARRSASSSGRSSSSPTRPTVSDSPCRSHIRPGLRPSVPRPPPRDPSLAAASVFSSVVVSPSSAGCSSAATTAPVSRSTA